MYLRCKTSNYGVTQKSRALFQMSEDKYIFFFKCNFIIKIINTDNQRYMCSNIKKIHRIPKVLLQVVSNNNQ